MSLKHVAHRRVHLERHQPSTRKKLGFLEKKKDYVKRARDFHQKEDQIKKLQRKAYFRNEDEFDFKMLSKQMKDGKMAKKATHLTVEEQRLLDSQDAQYVGLRENMDKQAVEKLKNNLHFLDADRRNKHTVFVDDDDLPETPATRSSSSSSSSAKAERKALLQQAGVTVQRIGGRKKNVDDFDVAGYFDTHPALLGRKANRLRTKQLQTAKLTDPKERDMASNKAYKELFHLQERSKRLRKVREALELKYQLRGTGRKRKVKDETKDGAAQWKWNYERKK